MTAADFCALLAPWPIPSKRRLKPRRLILGPDGSLPKRDARDIAKRATAAPTTGERRRKRKTLQKRVQPWTASNPNAATAPPSRPPSNVYDEPEGLPTHQVIISHKAALATPETRKRHVGIRFEG
jgi:hypothetical protein